MSKMKPNQAFAQTQLWLELRVKPTKQSSIRNDIDQKCVLIHPNDAVIVDIRDCEPALLIASDGSGAPYNSDSFRASLCKVRLASTAFASPKKKKEGNVISGEMHLLFPFLLEPKVSESSPNISKYTANVQSPSFVSPTKKSFSFAKGGGGESIISSPRKTTPSNPSFSFAKDGGDNALISPQKYTTPTGGNSGNCILIPLHNLEQIQLRRLCTDADELVLSPMRDTTAEPTPDGDKETSSHLLSSRNIIQTLIMSKYQGSYICTRKLSQESRADGNHEVVSIVYRGQLVSFRIVDVLPRVTKELFDDSSNPHEENALLNGINNLHIDNAPTADDINGDLSVHKANLDDMFKKCLKKSDDSRRKLDFIGFKITPRTSIRFMDETQKSTSIKIDNTKVCAGLDQTLSEIRDTLLPPILKPNLFPANGPLRPPKGVLLYGPAGVGKSLVASQIAQDLSSLNLIGTAKIHVKFIQCADILASTAIIGEAENKLTRIFEEAEREANISGGSLVILDDVDLICPRRGGIGMGMNGLGVDQLAGTLLALLDGIGTSKTISKGGFSVLAITTDPSTLDPALRRSGRLDSEIEVPVPDDNAREKILAFHIAQLSQSSNISISDEELKVLARLAKGFTGADCRLALKEALRNSMNRLFTNQKVKPNNKLECSNLIVEYADLEHGVRSTKPSAIKSVAVEVPRVLWSSIGGMEQVKALLKESIELPLTHSHLFEMMKVPPPKGILLYGPPGCSKTLMARAIATEGQMNFLAVKGPELLSKWLGESERALASLFRRARLASPSVIFFDELDAIASKRGEGGGGGGGDRLLSQLLTELDGVTSGTGGFGKKTCRVMVVGATNRPDKLDPALIRPGRMDKMIYVGLPDSDGRKGIFKIGLQEKACHDDVDVSVLARDEISKGYSGAEIIAICRDAALHAIGEMVDGSPDIPKVCMRHLLHSIQSMKPRTTQEMLDFYKSFRGQH